MIIKMWQISGRDVQPSYAILKVMLSCGDVL